MSIQSKPSIETRATGFRRSIAILALLPLALTACSINVQDDGYHHGDSHPRTATDQCRREVLRAYDRDYKVAFELAELSTNGGIQTVTQAFTLTPENGRGDLERRTLRCTVTNGVLTEVVTVR